MSDRVALLRKELQRGYAEGRIGHFTCTYPPHKVYSQVRGDFDVRRVWEDRGLGSPDVSGIGLYVHVPFCKQRCSFCNFFMVKERGGSGIIDKYIECLVREIEMYGPVLDRCIGDKTTVYFGGGTPSVLSPEQLHRVLTALHALTTRSRISEFTFEVAPETASRDYLASLRDLGVSRVSLGAQSVDEVEARRLARQHSRTHVMSLIEASISLGFETTNVDLIYGLSTQTLRGWRQTLLDVLDLTPQCLTIYPLNVKPLTGLAKPKRDGEANDVDRPLFYAMYDSAVEILEAAGYVQQTRTLFLRKSGQYLHKLNEAVGIPVKGFGAGAQSYAPRWHYRPGNSVRDPRAHLDTYIADLEASRFPIRYSYRLSTEEMQRRQIALSVRYRYFPLEPYRRRFGAGPDEHFPDEFSALREEALVEVRPSGIQLTKKGMRFDNLVSTLFFSDRVRTSLEEHNSTRWSASRTHPVGQ